MEQMDVEVRDLGEQIEEQGDPGRPQVDNFHKKYKEFDWNSKECAEGLASCRDEAMVIAQMSIMAVRRSDLKVFIFL